MKKLNQTQQQAEFLQNKKTVDPNTKTVSHKRLIKPVLHAIGIRNQATVYPITDKQAA